MVMEESVLHHGHHPLSPSEGDSANSNASNTNVYLVGLEFVRQYYTVLNQGPLYLHRFYSDDSSFVHGVSARDSKVAYGQQEIHKRIQSLNFHNCHAKIRQVDSHETLGNGVVIQVTGELSNNGQPMRRFMQTFVLAPQTPKRYYVRNDIFHYQDEVFCDEDADGDLQTESAIDTEDVDDIDRDSVMDANGDHAGIISAEPVVSIPVAVEVVSAKGSPPTNSNRGAQPPQQQQNKIEHQEVEEKVRKAEPVPVAVAAVSLPEPAQPVPSAPVEEEPPVAKTYANLFKSSGFSAPAPKPAAPVNKFPSQQANAHPGAKGINGPSGAVHNNDGSTTSPPQVSPQPTNTSSSVKGLPPRNPRGQGGYGNRDRGGDNNRPPGDRDQKERRERLTSRSSTTLNDETGSIDGDRRRPGPVHTYPDANQLFVGNLPHFVTVQDMKDIFGEFGEVAEVKIQKPTAKSGGMKVPYFCFVVFEDPASAQSAIDKKGEICMKMTGGSNRRLNVEQKRSQRGGGRGDDPDAPYNRMDTASPAGGRTSEGGNRNNSRTFRGSNRSGERDRNDRDQRGGDRNDRDRGDRDQRGDRDRNMGGGGGRGGNMNSGRGGGGGGGGGMGGSGRGGPHKP